MWGGINLMAYNPTEWTNREVERPRTFTVQNNPDGTITLTPSEGAITEPGTPIMADNMNKIEQGIVNVESDLDAHLSGYNQFKGQTENTISGITDPVNGTAARLDAHAKQSLDHTYNATATGTNALTLNAPNYTGNLVTGLSLRFKNPNNSTAAMTINANGKGVKAVVDSKGVPFTKGVANAIYTVAYNGVNFILQGNGGGEGYLVDSVIKRTQVGYQQSIEAAEVDVDSVGNTYVVVTGAIRKYSPTGAQIWNKTISGNVNSHMMRIKDDQIIIGYTDSVSAYDLDLNLKWTAALTPTGGKIITDMCISDSGNLYVTFAMSNYPNPSYVIGYGPNGAVVFEPLNYSPTVVAGKGLVTRDGSLYCTAGVSIFKINYATRNLQQTSINSPLIIGGCVTSDGKYIATAEDSYISVLKADFSGVLASHYMSGVINGLVTKSKIKLQQITDEKYAYQAIMASDANIAVYFGAMSVANNGDINLDAVYQARTYGTPSVNQEMNRYAYSEATGQFGWTVGSGTQMGTLIIDKLTISVE